MAAAERIWTAALVVIGDEILSGRTQDKNIAQIALWLNLQGIRLVEVRVVGDTAVAIAEAVNTLRARHDYLFTTGGIGPTHDDITVDAIAGAVGVPVVVHPRARAMLERYYIGRGGITDARLRMARVPEGAELIENRMSGAPGIRWGNIFIMAGGRCFPRRSAAGWRRARWPTCSARPRRRIPAARSAAIPFFAKAGPGPIS